LENEKSQTRRPPAPRVPIQRNEKGIPAGVITRKDALTRDDIIAARRQRNEGVKKKRQPRRNGAAEQSAGGHS